MKKSVQIAKLALANARLSTKLNDAIERIDILENSKSTVQINVDVEDMELDQTTAGPVSRTTIKPVEKPSLFSKGGVLGPSKNPFFVGESVGESIFPLERDSDGNLKNNPIEAVENMVVIADPGQSGMAAARKRMATIKKSMTIVKPSKSRS